MRPWARILRVVGFVGLVLGWTLIAVGWLMVWQLVLSASKLSAVGSVTMDESSGELVLAASNSSVLWVSAGVALGCLAVVFVFHLLRRGNGWSPAPVATAIVIVATVLIGGHAFTASSSELWEWAFSTGYAELVGALSVLLVPGIGAILLGIKGRART